VGGREGHQPFNDPIDSAGGMHASTYHVPLLPANELSEVPTQPSTLLESHTAITPIIETESCRRFVSVRRQHEDALLLYAFDAKALNPFVAQEYIDGEPLSAIWDRYTQTETGLVALKIAEIVVDMAEMRFSSIGGFASCVGGFASGTRSTLGPTVEGSKLFKGRVSLHCPLRRSLEQLIYVWIG
jgi:hypothetical protein